MKKELVLLALTSLTICLTGCPNFKPIDVPDPDDPIVEPDPDVNPDPTPDPGPGYELSDIKKTDIKVTYTDYSKYNGDEFKYTPVEGDAHILVIPISFTDSPLSDAQRADVRKTANAAYFGTSEETGWESVKSYYEKESRNNIHLDGVTADWYETNMDSEAVVNDYTFVYVLNDALEWYFAQPNSKPRTYFDCDQDGCLDGVIYVYDVNNASNGKYEWYDYPTEAQINRFWAFTTHLNFGSNVDNPQLNSLFWCSYDFLYGSQSGGYGDTSRCSIDTHTFIHEMGHMFGIPDFYDYNGQESSAGNWTMQDHNVCGHDPSSVLALGWADPYIPEETSYIEIKPFQESGDMILLTPSWNEYDSAFDEYILLEYYTPTGLNEFDKNGYSLYRYNITIPGIRVWHVDARLARYMSNGFLSTRESSDITVGNVAFFSDNNSGDRSCRYHDGGKYLEFSHLQLLTNQKFPIEQSAAHYNRYDSFNTNDLFLEGDKFDMLSSRDQFVMDGKLNNGSELGWSFEVTKFDSESAVIKVTKE